MQIINGQSHCDQSRRCGCHLQEQNNNSRFPNNPHSTTISYSLRFMARNLQKITFLLITRLWKHKTINSYKIFLKKRLLCLQVFDKIRYLIENSYMRMRHRDISRNLETPSRLAPDFDRVQHTRPNVGLSANGLRLWYGNGHSFGCDAFQNVTQFTTECFLNSRISCLSDE